MKFVRIYILCVIVFIIFSAYYVSNIAFAKRENPTTKPQSLKEILFLKKQKVQNHAIRGKITAISSTTLTLELRNGKTITLKTSSDFSNLPVGDTVKVEFEASEINGTFTLLVLKINRT